MKKYILITFILFSTCIYAQLNEFMIQTWFYDVKPENNTNRPPWKTDPLSFFEELKRSYNFNNIFFFHNCPDHLYKAVKNAGLSTVLFRSSLGMQEPHTAFNKQIALNELNKYSGVEYNVLGYKIVDEFQIDNSCFNPHLDPLYLIDSIPKYTNLIKEHNPNLLRYANFYPFTTYGFKTDYCYREEYIQKYIDIAKPNLLSFDQYPIFDQYPGFFMTLYNLTLKSSENSIPFVYILTPYRSQSEFGNGEIANYAYNAKSIPEFNYVIYAALTYGAKGISYWPGFEWVVSGIEYNFKLYYENSTLIHLSNLHKKLKEHSDELLSLNFASAYHVSTQSTINDGVEKIHSFSNWNYFSQDKHALQVFSNLSVPVYQRPGSVAVLPRKLMISFMTTQNGKIYFWLFNKSLDESMELGLNIRNYIVRDVFCERDVNPNIEKVFLSPGEAKLFEAYGTSPVLKSFNTVFNAGFDVMEVANSIDIGNTQQTLFNYGSTKSFIADQIHIKNMHAKEGSLILFKGYDNINSPVLTNRYSRSITDSYEEIEELKNEINIYPNPFNDYITIEIPFELGEIDLYDVNGRHLLKNLITDKNQINLSFLPKGVYVLRIFNSITYANYKIVKS